MPQRTLCVTTLFNNCCLKSESQLSKKLVFLHNWKPFKNNEKYFLFHVKSSFRS